MIRLSIHVPSCVLGALLSLLTVSVIDDWRPHSIGVIGVLVLFTIGGFIATESDKQG